MNLLRFLVMFVFLLHFSCSTAGQNFNYREIPTVYLNDVAVTKKERDSIRNTFKTAYFIEDALPEGFSKNGTHDYTSQIQTALNENREVIFPEFPILINEKGLTIRSNSRLLFGEKSKLILKPNNLGQHEILRIHDAENISVYFANIVGDRYKHLGTDGEWGMGISVRGTKKILLYAPVVKECWGDGIYLGMSPVTQNVINENVTIYKGIVDNNRRNGMSIISGQNLNVNRFIAANTSGTPPHAGIDVEPDSNTDLIKNLNFDGVTVFNNETHGLLFALGNLAEKMYNIGTINIRNFKADTGYLGISFKLASDKKERNFNPNGTINVENARFSKMSRSEFLSYDENTNNNINVHVKMNSNDEEKKIRQQLNNSNKFRVTK